MTTLEPMLNDAGYKKYSKINPLILQSKVIKLVEKWLQQNRKDDTINPYQHRDDTFIELLGNLKKKKQ